jgi:hypothetical protein
MSQEPLTDEKLDDFEEIAHRRKELFATEPATTTDAMELFSFVEMTCQLAAEVRRLRALAVLEKKRDRTVSRLPKRKVATVKARQRSAARRKVKRR